MTLIKVLQHALYDIQLGHIDESLPGPDDFKEFCEEWDIPEEHRFRLDLLSQKADSILEQIEELEREVRTWLKNLEGVSETV